MRIALIASPRSGRNRRNPGRLARLEALCAERDIEFAAPDGLDAMAAVVRGWCDAGLETLVIDGGDGTVHRVISAVLTHQGPTPRFAILPGGTMNIAARSTGWMGSPRVALDRLVQGRVVAVPRSVLCVDGVHYGFLFGNGLLARFLEVYEEGEPTVLRAAWILARGALSALVGGALARRLTRRWTGKVTVDGQLVPREDWLAVAAGTVEQIGLGFRPFRMTGTPGTAHVVGLGSSVARFAFELPRVYTARPLSSPANLEWSASRLRLEGAEPMGFMVDGDFHRGEAMVTVDVGPTIELWVPGESS